MPVVDFRVEGLLTAAQERNLPFVDDGPLHGRLVWGTNGKWCRLFPLSIACQPFAGVMHPDLSMLWILHDGPFAKFAWRTAFLDGRCVTNDVVNPAAAEGAAWTVVVEADYVDCAALFLGELEVRDLLERGHIAGSIAALSALSWFVERDESIERAQRLAEPVARLRDWVAIARSDEMLAGAK